MLRDVTGRNHHKTDRSKTKTTRVSQPHKLGFREGAKAGCVESESVCLSVCTVVPISEGETDREIDAHRTVARPKVRLDCPWQ